MLVNYRKPYAKIAMGLLALAAKERSCAKVQQLFREYEETPERKLYLWKEGDACIGLAGIELTDDRFIVRHLSVNPSYQGEGIGTAILENLQTLLAPRTMEAGEDVKSFCTRCDTKKRIS